MIPILVWAVLATGAAILAIAWGQLLDIDRKRLRGENRQLSRELAAYRRAGEFSVPPHQRMRRRLL